MDAEDTRERPWVSLVGSGSGSPRGIEDVEAVARHLADRGAVLVTGGLGGVMEAACRAYRDAGGPASVGILPGTRRQEANPHVDVPVVTGLGHVRNALVAANGDAVVAFPGAGGTTSEIGFARIHGIPVVGIGAWEGLEDIVAVDDVAEGLEVLDGILDGILDEVLGDAGGPPPGGRDG